MLLKVCCSSFSTVTACTFDWLTDGTSLIKTNLNRLINSVCFRVQSITETLKLQCKSTQWKMQYMVHENTQWKVQYMVLENNMENTV